MRTFPDLAPSALAASRLHLDALTDSCASDDDLADGAMIEPRVSDDDLARAGLRVSDNELARAERTAR